MSEITVGSPWKNRCDGVEAIVKNTGNDCVGFTQIINGKEYFYTHTLAEFKEYYEPKFKADMVNHPPHYKDESGIECIEVTQHMRFCEGNSFKYVYRAGSKGSLIEDLKKAAWYAERSWTRSRTGNDRIHWLVKRKGEAIADSRDKQGKPFIADVMRNIVNNRWCQAYDSLMTEIARLESE